ncbi:MAG: penicillin acylase family protein [Azospirillum sp.]|nr:penicillin acylase family protein [Azospirillum sp.]
MRVLPILRASGRVAIVAASLIALGAAAGYMWLRSSLPLYDGTIGLPGLSGRAEVVRDRDGVPHIFADSALDAYRALGYAHAQDRLWQMEMTRRFGAGRLAELFGPWFGEWPARLDRLTRTLGLYRLAESSYAALAPEVQRALDAYADGVNAYLTERREALPVEFQLLAVRPETWRPADSLVWGKLMALQLSGNYREELLRARLVRRLGPERANELFPGYPPGAPVTLPSPTRTGLPHGPRGVHTGEFGADIDPVLARMLAALPSLGPDTASNLWVLAGQNTTTGRPLLANDPHLGLQAPILWYLARIETPDLKLAGATVPGVPFHLLGHNASLAWGISSTHSDTQDLFVEQIDPVDPSRYLAPDGASLPFQTRLETIKVRGRADVVFTVRATRHGPVISDVEDAGGSVGAEPGTYVLALAFTGLGGADTTAEAFYRLNRATDRHGVQEALRFYQTPQQNIAFADTAGTIGFQAPGLVPVRTKGDGRVPVPGWSGDYDWSGEIPYDQLPAGINPPSGRYVNANNAVTDTDYPWLLTADWPDPFRAERIEELLDQTPRQSLDSTAALQLDTLSPVARQLLPLMLETPTTTPLGAAAIELLRHWNGRMDRDRPEPLIFEWWLRDLNRALYADELGPLFGDYWNLNPRVVAQVLTGTGPWCDDAPPPATRHCEKELKRSLESTLDALTRRHGTDLARWRWGDEHRAPLGHPLFGRIPVIRDLFDIGIETDGSVFTINRGTSRIGDPETPFAHIHGPGYRSIYDLSDLQRSRFIITTGQSGNPLSPHYDDFVRRWRDGGSITLTGSPDAVARGGLGRLQLVPVAPAVTP